MLTETGKAIVIVLVLYVSIVIVAGIFAALLRNPNGAACCAEQLYPNSTVGGSGESSCNTYDYDCSGNVTYYACPEEALVNTTLYDVTNCTVTEQRVICGSCNGWSCANSISECDWCTRATILNNTLMTVGRCAMFVEECGMPECRIMVAH